MAIANIDPSAPTQEEQIEMALVGMKAKLAQAIAVEGAKTLLWNQDLNPDQLADKLSQFSVKTAEAIIESYRPKHASNLKLN